MSEEYYRRIKAALASFWTPAQTLRCTAFFRKEGSTCGLCGKHPITWNYVLRNQDTGVFRVVGSNCIVEYKKITGVSVSFRPQLAGPAEYLNTIYPDTAVITEEMNDAHEPGDHELDEQLAQFEYLDGMGLDAHDPDFWDLAPEGLHPYEIDWDSQCN